METITKEEYKKAALIVESYNQQKNKSLIRELLCICCRENSVKPLNDLTDGHVSPLEQEKGMWVDGTVELISMGYGSDYDTEEFYVAICDKCVGSLLNENVIIHKKDLQRKLKTY